ncbi:restriction endonuclease subunit S [Acidovorax sp. ACV01]|uniref:restriction endonuclease subunit S n=1 Tax=Acidovorax sp. ACV01 TaxID=2769311 RepID=UPI001783889E|nr:restriction endonuclease subunit S [Acidovorax sp. ACV01]
MTPFATIESACELVTDGTHYTPKDVGAGIPFLTVKDVSGEGLDFENCSFISESDFILAKAGNSAPRRGDVLFSKDGTVGKVHVVSTDRPFAVLSSLAILRPNPTKANADYLGHVLRFPAVLDDALKKKTGSAIRRIVLGDLKRVRFPLPKLEEQRRIAAILDQAETLRTQRRTALALLDSLTQSLFLDMFGDPVANPKGWPAESLTDLCHCYSGGTPSKAKKEYWEGELPWFSAKDMKAEDLFDSEDHISEQVPETTTLKLLPKDTVAIVVRGMILAHTFPVCVLRIPATINQDLKALLPKQPVNSQFLAACLRSQSGFVLEKVSEAGHGTKRLDAQGLQSIRIPRPGDALEQTFATRIASIEALKATHRRALAALDALFASLQQQAFSGELTLAAPRSPAQSLEQLQQLEAAIGLEALIFIAKRMPDGDLYNSLKAIYFADRHHLEHYGHQIYNETYCALPHGPVPQSAYDATRVLIGERMFSDFDDDAMRAALRRNDKKLTALRDADFSKLSRSVVESLEWAVRYCSDMKFGQTKTASHDSAYERTPKNETIPLQYIIDTLPPEARQRHWNL